ncbi:MAG TPA: hypothetical protein VFM54_05705 [Micromonosporaceae bacterium]|nr:hypothetical protein [Micromonosporaceae bacterium]
MASQAVADTGAFHGGSAAYSQVGLHTLKRDTVVERELAYRFRTHFHPYVHELIHELVEKSVAGLQAADTDYLRTTAGQVINLPNGRPHPRLYEEFFAGYAPTSRVTGAHPVKDIDFSSTGAYSCYNWELFFHVPLTIGIHLSRAQRFEEAQRWFHYIFDPTVTSVDPAPMRYWKVRRFHEIEVLSIEKVLTNLATHADAELLADTVASIHAWKDAPFRPHVVARWRQSAYMVKTVTAYLDNLIDWGDALFRQDTGESVSEATQLYVLAANLLGPRPQEVPRKGWQQPQSYESLRPHLDELGNAMTELHVDIPFDLLPAPSGPSDSAALQTVASLGSALYFCVPRNDKLLGYWDIVADRLFKIRNSLNVQGIFRQLPLFDPPIDPALLAKAVAAGVDIGALMAGLNQPHPPLRFTALIGRAAELAREVASLGSQLLASVEKEDAESLAVLRAQFERSVLARAELVQYQQWQEAVKSREAVQKTFAAAVARYTFYERQLGKAENEISVPGLDDLDLESMRKLRFSSTETDPTLRPLTIDIVAGVTGEAAGRKISSFEATELAKLDSAQKKREHAAMIDRIGAALGMIPTFGAQFEPFGTGGTISFGGNNLAAKAAFESAASKQSADTLGYEAGLAGKVGTYARRELEWAYQSNVAAGEISVTYKHWRAAQIREAIAEQEFRNHQRQIAEAEEIEQFLAGEKVRGSRKTSTVALYTWLRREVRALYNASLALACDVARKAERALQHELGDPQQSFLQLGYSSGKEGLLAGERLLLDIKRMEDAYHDLNQREYELTRHVSLRQLDPVALLRLRATGYCELAVPEGLFDLDCPGHYFRRIRSVAVSIPSVAGPYSGVACTLTLLSSTVRISPQLADGEYARAGEDTERFRDQYARIESIVTSSGVNDSGLFETNLRDERFLPFEGAGAVSRWSLRLPSAVRQFDYDSIPDVVLHLRYTAREGGLPLRAAAQGHLTSQIEQAAAVGSVRLLSLRRDFPTEWARFTATPLAGNARAPFTVALREDHYPFWADTAAATVTRLELFAQPGAEQTVTASADSGGQQPMVTLTADGAPEGLLWGKLPDDVTPPAAVGSFTWYFDDNTMDDAWVALTWGTA